MPKICRCGKIVQDVCECSQRWKCKAKTTVEAGYDRQHRNASERYRKEKPLCERCVMLLGVLQASGSQDLHHIYKIKHCPELRMQPRNWLALCRTHHEELERNEIEAVATKRWSDENYERMLHG